MDFSVLISIYRGESPAYFREALDSLFAQTLQPAEIVLVRDGPLTPELDAVIAEYTARHPLFRIVRNETNLGLGPALARGVRACSHEYIVRMDTDDIIPPERFAKQIARLEERYDVVSCWSQTFEGDPSRVIAVKRRPEHHEEILRLAHRRSPVCHAGSAFRRSAVLGAGNYEDHPYYEDYDLWVRMLLRGCRFYNIQEVLYYVRTSRAMIARRGGWKYMIREIGCFRRFYRLGFYSLGDLLRNIATHSAVRILPVGVRAWALKKIWNTKQQ